MATVATMLAVAIPASLAVVGLATAPASASAPAASSPAAAGLAARVSSVSWGDCDDPFLVDLGLECGQLKVPLNYNRPGGKKITLALSRLEHTSSEADYQGIMLTNPGGPGGSGTWVPYIAYFVPGDSAFTYDWIGFDPRGVGSSRPALTCDASYGDPPRPPYTPFRREVGDAWLAKVQGYAADCGANGGRLLKHLTTADNARDMNSIRQALGEDIMNYYGYSYGTYLGAVYATLFPGHVGRMVLDSNVDPGAVWEQANFGQDYAFEKVINIWFAWLARYNRVYHLGATQKAVSRTYYHARNALARNPADGIIGPSEFTDIFLTAGYGQWSWSHLGTALSAWVNDRDATGLADEYGYDDNGYAMYLGTVCTEGHWTTDSNVVRRQNWRIYQKAPFVTWGNAWFNGPCAFWPSPTTTPVTVDGTGVPPILLIDETLDAATPFSGSLEVRRLFPNSSLIAIPGGTSHAVSPSGDPCLDDQIAAYLTDGTLPARLPGYRADSRCAALPKPVPDELAVATRTGSTSGRLTRAELWLEVQSRLR